MSRQLKAKGAEASAKSSRRKPANINQVKTKIRELAKQHSYDELTLLEFAEFVHGGKFKPMEPSLQELKEGLFQVFDCKNLQELLSANINDIPITSNPLEE